jgi:hypothetical protein
MPAISPYLNLNRLGAPPAINYYNLVRPQIDYGTAIQGLEQQVVTGQQNVAGIEAAVGAPTTGHAVGFQNHLRYFLTLRRQSLNAAPGTLGGGFRPPTQPQQQQPPPPPRR